MVKTKGSTGKVYAFFLLVTAAGFWGTGCVGGIRSAVHIDSTPPGATVTVNYVERGRTPIEIPILWYWYYKIEVEKEGYKKIEKDERFYAPFYAAIPPLDLLVEIIPIPIKNTYYRTYVLEPEEVQ